MAVVVVESDGKKDEKKKVFNFIVDVKRTKVIQRDEVDSLADKELDGDQLKLAEQVLSIEGVEFIVFPTSYSMRVEIGKAFDSKLIQNQVIGCIENTIYRSRIEEGEEMKVIEKGAQKEEDQSSVEVEDPRQSPFPKEPELFER